MKQMVIGSLRKNAGKTSLIAGLAGVLDARVAYMKPIGDRLVYRRKRLWDHDSAAMLSLLKSDDDPDAATIGFEPEKLRFIYKETGIKDKLREMADALCSEDQTLLVEGGRDLTYGSYVGLDPVSVAQTLDARLVLVVRGDERKAMDDTTFLTRRLALPGIELAGVVINKVRDPEDFCEVYLPELRRLEIPILGLIPYTPELDRVTVQIITSRLQAKLLAGEASLDRRIRGIVVGPMSLTPTRSRSAPRLDDKLVVTAGDHNGEVLAAIERGAQAVLLTDDLVPSARLIARFEREQVPLLLTGKDCFSAARAVQEIEPLLENDDTERWALLTDLVREHVDLDALQG